MKPKVDVAQTPWELERLVDIVRARNPTRILEVGVWEGGTLWEWLQIAEVVVAIDDTMRDPGPSEWKAWAKEAGSALRLLHGSSHDPAIVDMAREVCPYEFVFIDADHTYESVRRDSELYGPMVADGGLLAFHDIRPRPGYGVDRLWCEIRDQVGAQTIEIVETQPGQAWQNGIGALWM